MARKPIMAGNWKMNMNHVDAVGLVQKLAFTLQDKGYDPEASECVVIPPFTGIRTVQTLIEGDRLPIVHGAQDVSEHDDGAYTGDISADMLAKLGCTYVIVGHSERRQYHGETDELVNAKAVKALSKGLTPIICVGESLEVRKAGQHVEFTVAQVRGALAGIPAGQVAGLVIAYEPVWAIGTGKTATAAQAQEIHAHIRQTIAAKYGATVADATSILYGGSCNAGNARELFANPDVDGGLIGGASLEVEKFLPIIEAF